MLLKVRCQVFFLYTQLRKSAQLYQRTKRAIRYIIGYIKIDFIFLVHRFVHQTPGRMVCSAGENVRKWQDFRIRHSIFRDHEERIVTHETLPVAEVLEATCDARQPHSAALCLCGKILFTAMAGRRGVRAFCILHIALTG